MIKEGVIFSSFLLVTLLLLFVVHLFVSCSQISICIPDFLLTYIFNFSVTSLFYFCFLLVQQKNSSSLGFVFLASFLIKVLLFFVVVRPTFVMDGEMSKNEFFIFFIPYAVSLVIETTFLVRKLNRIEEQKSS